MDIFFRQELFDRFHRNQRVDLCYMVSSSSCLVHPEQCNLGQQLPIQVGWLKNIAVHHAQSTYSDPGKHIDEVSAQSAAANHQNSSALKQLPFFLGQGRYISHISGLHGQPPPTGGNSATISPSLTGLSGFW